MHKQTHTQKLWRLYSSAPVSYRALAALRPIICPLDYLIDAVPDGSSVLDIGCGAGVLLVSLAMAGKISHGVGLDLSQKAISVAQQVATSQSLPLNFHVNEKNGTFDVVLLIDVLHHIPSVDQKNFMCNALKKVKPGGRLIVKDMTHKPRWQKWGNQIHDLILARQFIHHIPIKKVEAWADEMNCRQIMARDFSVSIYGHRLRVFSKPA